ncbi:MAG: DUF3035 domain-containing protein [Alphaproteobacteria bacterium]|nr:MAG: DUF3035 domain-containing protein [Alphaproteobacteria bacterium]
MKNLPLSSSIFYTLVALCVLGGCDSTKKALGLQKVIPDEHTLMERPPLTTPKDLYTLYPPKTGDPEASYRTLRADGGEKKRSLPSTLSVSEKNLLNQADASARDPDVRKKLGDSVK